MQTITHTQQQEIWNKEHATPFVLPQMDSSDPSSGVIPFFKFLKENINFNYAKGIEMGCGKGRNVIYLAQQGISMTGIDFSKAAITEAKKRAQKAKVKNVNFVIHDVIKPWPFTNELFGFAIDCFATTDIETSKGRKFAVGEMKRVVKKSGYILVYLMSPQDEFHKEMIKVSPATEKNAFLHSTTGKFEKVFDLEEIEKIYSGLKIIEKKRINKTTTFFGKEYKCYNHWIIFQKN